MVGSTHPWFHDTVSALAYSLGQPHANSPERQAPYNDLTRFILTQHAQLPDYLRRPMLAATLAFDLPGFHQHTPEVRAKKIHAWKAGRIGFQRDLIRYLESLATLALYSRGVPAATANPVVPASPATVPPLEWESDKTLDELRAEIVVIGSGPGGAITAGLLAEAGRDVLLIEEGEHWAPDSCPPFSLAEMLQKYRNGGQTVTLGRNKISYVEGRCVGGGSEINSGLYHRTPAEILANWRTTYQVEGLTDAEMAPHFVACEQDVSVSLLPGPPPAASLKLHAGASKLGWQSLEVPRWFRYEKSDATGKRQSMAQTFIPRFLRAGGRLQPSTRALRLRQNARGWLIEARHADGREIRIAADAVFLCAGAVHTPTLLLRSGITRNIGESLQVHPTVKMVARFDDPVNSTDLGVPVHQVKEFAPRLSFGCSISSPAYLALGLIDHPAAAREVGTLWSRAATYYAMITSQGRGSVRTLPGFRDPVVRYALTKADRRNLADGLRKLAQILFAAGARVLYPSLPHSPALHRDDGGEQLPTILPDGRANLMTIHLFSSCPMGEDRTKCATDSFGRLHGFKNLFINDASLLCTAPGVNPQGSIMAIARRNTRKFLGQL